MVLIYFLGIDGSGKTTSARRLAMERLEGWSPVYVYCQHKPFLIWILKLPAKFLFMRKLDQFADYDTYKSRKDAVRSRNPVLARIYGLLTYLDVLLQAWLQILFARARGNLLVLDRYYLDWVVNQGVVQEHSTNAMLRHARLLERLLPKASHHIFLDVTEDVAFRRKGDIQGLQYLKERRHRYLQLASHYDFKIVNAERDAESVFQDVRAIVGRELEMDLQRASACSEDS
jgi:thymidylate kinase